MTLAEKLCVNIPAAMLKLPPEKPEPIRIKGALDLQAMSFSTYILMNGATVGNYLCDRYDTAYKTASRMPEIVINYVVGDWQKKQKTPDGKIDPDYWRTKINWSDLIQVGLMWSAVLRSPASIRSILQKLDPSSRYSFNGGGLENRYYFALRDLFDDTVSPEMIVAKLETVASPVPHKLAKKWSAIAGTVKSILLQDRAAVSKYFEAFMAYWLKHELVRNAWKLSPEGTFLFHFAAMEGIDIPLQEKLEKHIIQLPPSLWKNAKLEQTTSLGDRVRGVLKMKTLPQSISGANSTLAEKFLLGVWPDSPENTRKQMESSRKSKFLDARSLAQSQASDSCFLAMELYLLGRHKDVRPAAKEAVMFATDYYLGDWQKTLPNDAKKIDPGYWHQSLEWFPHLPKAVLWGSVVEAWSEVARLLQFMDDKCRICLPGEQGKASRQFYIALQHYFNSPVKERVKTVQALLKPVVDGKKKPYSQMAETFLAILDGDTKNTAKHFNATFKSWFSDKPDDDLFLAVEPSILYHIAVKEGIEIPLKDDQKDHIVRLS